MSISVETTFDSTRGVWTAKSSCGRINIEDANRGIVKALTFDAVQALLREAKQS